MISFVSPSPSWIVQSTQAQFRLVALKHCQRRHEPKVPLELARQTENRTGDFVLRRVCALFSVDLSYHSIKKAFFFLDRWVLKSRSNLLNLGNWAQRGVKIENKKKVVQLQNL